MDENKISIAHMEGQVEDLGFATELLIQLKNTIKKLWVSLIIVLFLWAATIGAFV